MSSKYEAEKINPFADELECGGCHRMQPRQVMNVLKSGGLKRAHPFSNCLWVCNECRDFMFVPIENNIANAMEACR